MPALCPCRLIQAPAIALQLYAMLQSLWAAKVLLWAASGSALLLSLELGNPRSVQEAQPLLTS